MNKIFQFSVIVFAFVALTSCNQTKTTDRQTQTIDSTTVAQQNKPPMNYGDEGAVYVDREGNEMLRILSEGEKTLSVKDLTNDKIYVLQLVESVSGIKYEDADGFYFWVTDDGAVFGQKNREIYSNLKLKN